MERNLKFAGRSGGRYGWSRFGSYVPPVYSFLTDEEWNVIDEWYDDTEKVQMLGECNIPFISVVQGFIMGSVMSNVIQLGHYAGYSSLLLGFMQRRMGKKRSVMTIDINESCCEYTQRWVNRAGLGEYVTVVHGDSADSEMVNKAKQLFSGIPPQVIVIDSSHQYQHTLREFDLWFPVLEEGGFIFLHDSGEFAKAFDSTKNGGVNKAIEEWLPGNPLARSINISPPAHTYDNPIYKDPCGIGIIQKGSGDVSPAGSRSKGRKGGGIMTRIFSRLG